MLILVVALFLEFDQVGSFITTCQSELGTLFLTKLIISTPPNDQNLSKLVGTSAPLTGPYGEASKIYLSTGIASKQWSKLSRPPLIDGDSMKAGYTGGHIEAPHLPPDMTKIYAGPGSWSGNSA